MYFLQEVEPEYDVSFCLLDQEKESSHYVET